MKIFLIFVFTIGFVACSPNPSQSKCNQYSKQAESILKNVLRIGNHIGPPANMTDFNNYCSDGKRSFQFMKQYSRCLSGLPRQVFSILTRNIRGVLTDYCGTESGKKAAFEYLQAFDKVRSQKYRKCLYEYSASMKYSTKANDNKIIVNMCCGFKKMESCMLSVFKSGENYIQSNPSLNMPLFVKKFINQIFGDVFDLICGSYKSYDQCVKIEPEEMKKMDAYTNAAKIDKNNAIFVKHLVQLSSAISDV